MQRIEAPPRSSGGSKVKFWAGGALIVVAIAALIFNGVRAGGSYYLTVDELAAREGQLIDRGVRVNGEVDKNSVDWNSRAITLAFDIVNPESGARRSVRYEEPMPDLFMKSESVIVEGVIEPDGTLAAHTILVKCPSKYEEAQANGEVVPEDHFTE